MTLRRYLVKNLKRWDNFKDFLCFFFDKSRRKNFKGEMDKRLIKTIKLITNIMIIGDKVVSKNACVLNKVG